MSSQRVWKTGGRGAVILICVHIGSPEVDEVLKSSFAIHFSSRFPLLFDVFIVHLLIFVPARSAHSSLAELLQKWRPVEERA